MKTNGFFGPGPIRAMSVRVSVCLSPCGQYSDGRGRVLLLLLLHYDNLDIYSHSLLLLPFRQITHGPPPWADNIVGSWWWHRVYSDWLIEAVAVPFLFLFLLLGGYCSECE